MNLTRTRSDKVFDIINFILLTFALLVVAYPIYFILIASVSNPYAVNAGEVFLIPKGINFDGYAKILEDPQIWTGYKNSIIYTVLGTSINIVLTLMGAYALSRKELKGKGFITGMLVFTMLFGGGLIPRYILVKNMNMIDKTWAMIIPNACKVYYIIIARTFFKSSIPDSLYEAASIDGCSHTRYFLRIVLPLSSAIIAVLVLFYGIEHWNAYFNALIYLNKYEKYPLQLVLRDILIKNEISTEMTPEDMTSITERELIAEKLKYGVMIVASVPFLVLYPFMQKYFVKGVMLGSVKG